MYFNLKIIIALICLNELAHCKSYSPPLNPDSNIRVVYVFSSIEGSDLPNVSIVGGKPAAVGEFPSLALLKLVNGNICSGTLIDPNYILTAAHCLSGLTQSQVSTLTVYINTLSINGGGTGSATRGVSKFISHQLFNRTSRTTHDNDIALLVLSSPVTTITPVKLPTDSQVITVKPTIIKTTTKKPSTTMKTTTRKLTTAAKPCSCAFPTRKSASPVFIMRAFSTYANSPAVIAGWGSTTIGGGGVSNVLLKTDVLIQDNSVCTSQYDNYFNAANMLCAGDGSAKKFCQSDDGGPIFVNGVQVGIMSFPNGCDPLNYPYTGVYTRLTSYFAWIVTTKANNPPPTVG